MASPQWRALNDADLPALVELSERVRAADGAHPMAVTEAYLRSRFLTGEGRAAVDTDRLVAAVGVRRAVDPRTAIGLVDPGRRTRGLGSAIVEWARSVGVTRFETEGLTDDADALWRAHGLRQTFAEDVMAYDLTAGAPQVPLAADVLEWSDELAPRFYAVYHAAFRDRPGFPGWTQRQWVDWLTDDDEFAPQWTLLATAAGEDVGFVAGGLGAWVVQVGIVPLRRGTGLGAGLTAEALRRMRTAGESVCYLDVNVNNPGAIRIYQRLGFERIGRRARYEAT